MGTCCCSPRIGSIYPIEESLLNAMIAFKIRKYSLLELKPRLKKIFEKTDKTEIKNDLRELFLNNNYETNVDYVIQNTIFDLIIGNLEKLTVKDILLLVFPMINNSEESDKLKFVDVLSEYYDGEYNCKYLEFTLKKIIKFYTKKLTELMGQKLDNKSDKKCCENMNLKLFSDKKIDEYLDIVMDKERLDDRDSWKDYVTNNDCLNIIKRSKIWDFEEIRNSFLMN